MAILFGRTTLHRLHAQVNRNLLRNHHARYESTKQNATASPNAQPKQRTIPGPSWAWIDPFMRPLRAYGRMQQRSPLTTQLESTLIIYYLGDLCSQSLSSDVFTTHPYEPIRGLRAMLIGSLSSIPSYKWFIFLGNNFNYSSHIVSISVKILINQTVFTPVFNTYFFGMQTLLSGGSLREAKDRVVAAVPISWRNSWKVWPAVTAFSFTFVPWQYRNVFAGIIAIGWQGYLSWLNRKEEKREEGVGGRFEKGRVGERFERELEGLEMEREEEERKPVKKRKKRRKVEKEKVQEREESGD